MRRTEPLWRICVPKTRIAYAACCWISLASLTEPDTLRETMSAPMATAITSKPMAIPTISSTNVTPRWARHCALNEDSGTRACETRVIERMSGPRAIVGGGIAARGIRGTPGRHRQILKMAGKARRAGDGGTVDEGPICLPHFGRVDIVRVC